MRPVRDLRVAVGFLTRVPVGDVGDDVEVAAAVPWFPVVGAAIGLAVGGVWWALVEVLPPFVAASLAVATGLVLTGAFHHDGLADVADAFGGGWSVDQRLEILKDSRLGTYGTAALAMVLIIEIGAVASLSPEDGFGALVAAHVLGRSAAVAVMPVAPVAGDGLGAAYTRELRTAAVAAGLLAGLVVALVASPVFVAWPVLGAVGSTTSVVALAIRKIGGISGDVLGAIAVCASVSALVITVAIVG